MRIYRMEVTIPMDVPLLFGRQPYAMFKTVVYAKRGFKTNLEILMLKQNAVLNEFRNIDIERIRRLAE